MGTLTDDEKANARRHMGYPPIGSGPGAFEGWRFFQRYSLMEYRFDNMSPSEETIFRGYLTKCTTLDDAVLTSGDNLDTDEAAVWTRNKTEHADRERLYRSFRLRLCNALGVHPGPNLEQSGGIEFVI